MEKMMPTGYTADVGDGKITEFSDFALLCARAFGATIEMRDQPMDAPIPDEFGVEPFYAESVQKALLRLDDLQAMSPQAVDIARDDAEFARAASIARMNRESQEKRERYEAMLALVKAWVPPTDDHTEMKKFMTDQLNESIKFDCATDWNEYSKPTPPARQWHADEIVSAAKAHSQAVKSHEDAIARARQRSSWVKDLKGSLK